MNLAVDLSLLSILNKRLPDLFIFPWLLHSSRHHRGKTENWDFRKLKGGDNEYHLVINLAVDLLSVCIIYFE